MNQELRIKKNHNPVIHNSLFILHASRQRGLTAVELIVALSIFFIVGVLGLGAFTSFKRAADLTSSVDGAVTFLIQARSKTLSAEDAASHGVHFEAVSFSLFNGSSYAPSDPLNQTVVLPLSAEIASTSLAGGGSDVIFKKLSGETDNYGTITFQLKANPSKMKIITVQKTGLVTVD